MLGFKSFSSIWRSLLVEAMGAHVEVNQRTGEEVYVLAGARYFTLDLSDRLLPLPDLRKVFPKSAAAELAWFLMGTQDVTWMAKYAPFWNKFTEDDGKTIANAYGYRWLRHFGRNQLQQAIGALTENPSDRRIYISAWDPACDGLGTPAKNVPCPVGYTLSITAGQLHSTMLIRSSDLFVGLPYDVMGHALLMAAVARSLGVKLGTMTFTLAHPHLYEKHFDMLTECFQTGAGPQPVIELPQWSVADIQADPDRYVATLASAATLTDWPVANPRPEVIP